MAFVVADDKVEDFLKEKADKDKVKQIYKVAERFEQHHKPKPQTNADRIRSMSDEELAKFLHNFNDCDCCLIEVCNEGTCGIGCTEGILKWMKSEAKE